MRVAEQVNEETYYTLGTELSKMWIKAEEKIPPAMMPVLALVEVKSVGWLVWSAFVSYKLGRLEWNFPLISTPAGAAKVHYWMPQPWRPG
jgi:hypothetical protein